MAAGNPDFNALLSSTLANYRNQYADNLSKSFFLMWWLTSGDRKRPENGGESIVVQLMYGKNTTVRSYDGYEILDTTPQEGLTAVKFPWKQVAATVSISRKEERQNSGESRLINLLDSKIKQSEISMRDELNAMWFGDGTGNGSKDMFGLQLIVEDGAFGTLGGIDRSLTENAWWRNQQITGVGAFGNTTNANGIIKMRTLYNSSSRGNEHPNIGITTQTVFELYEGCLASAERFEDKRTGDAGFQNLKFKGMVLGFDEQCPPGLLYMLNSNYLEYVVDSETDMINTPFQTPENQDARVSKILVMGNMVPSNCARQGVMAGITA